MPFIYTIKNNINNKVYIGKTNQTIEKRWKEHQQDYQKKSNQKRPIYSAIKKYGIENFSIHKIEECSLEKVCEREIYWIEKYNSFINGYNATKGGDGKHYANYNLIVKKYLELKTLKKVKQETKYDIKTIKTALAINNIELFKKQKIIEFKKQLKDKKIKKEKNIKLSLKKEVKNKIKCKKCEKELDSRNKTGYCKICYHNEQKIQLPEKEVLKNKIRNQSFYSIAKEYNVGRTTIFRWCDKYNLPSTKEKINLISNEEWETI